MKLIISKNDRELSAHFESDGSTIQGNYEDTVSMLLNTLSMFTKDFIKKLKPSDKRLFSEHLYDSLDSAFGHFLRDTFPGIAPTDAQFGLTEAAIIYAQDQIIKKAEKEGKTYEQMIDEYNAIANKYLLEKKGLN